MRSIKEASDLSGKKVFIRADFNVPVLRGSITNDYRIQKTLPLIERLLAVEAKIILASHIESESNTLKPVFEYLNKKYKVVFIEDYKDINDLSEYFEKNDIILLENLRQYDGEKENDGAFAKHLANLADVYVNEAFSVSHREHASIVGIPKHLPSFAGLHFEEEVSNLSKVFNPEHPFVFILGGAKFETKLPLIDKFYLQADSVFIGGAIANDFFLAKGLEIGDSKVSQVKIDIKKFQDGHLLLPDEVVISGSGDRRIGAPDGLATDEKIVDISSNAISKITKIISEAKLIVWNGPMGNYEVGFSEGTRTLAEIIAESSAHSIVGGGDTVACLSKEIQERFSFVSTGGGAMLEFLVNETLPGIEALD